MRVCVGVWVWVAHTSKVKTKKLRFFRIFFFEKKKKKKKKKKCLKTRMLPDLARSPDLGRPDLARSGNFFFFF